MHRWRYTYVRIAMIAVQLRLGDGATPIRMSLLYFDVCRSLAPCMYKPSKQSRYKRLSAARVVIELALVPHVRPCSASVGQLPEG